MKSCKKRCVVLVAGMLLIVCLSPAIRGQEVPESRPAETPSATRPAQGLPESRPGEGPEAIHLSLQECVALALAMQADMGNFALRIARLDPEIARTGITEAEAAFDPMLSLSTLFTDSHSLATSTLAGAAMQKEKTWTFGVGLSKRFLSGALVELTYGGVRSNSNASFLTVNPSYDLDAGISITQPLLRNAGPSFNSASIRLASNTADRSEHDLRAVALEVVRAVHEAYWNLVFTIENLEVRKKSLALAEGVLEDNRKRLAVGSIAPLEVAGAKADVDRQTQEIIVAEATIAQARDELRNLINRPRDPLEDDLVIIPRDTALLTTERVNAFDAVREALAYRPDLKQAEIDIRSSEINIAVARNQLLPAVDLVATFNRNGLAGAFEPANTGLWHNGNTRDWGGGLNVEIPLGNRAARSVLARSRLESTKAVLAYDNLRRIVILDVKSTVRLVETSLARVRAEEARRSFAEKNLIAEEQKLNVGTSTSLDVLQAQELLSQAESTELRAIVNYTIALAVLEESKGTLLERVGVTVESVRSGF